MVLSCQTGQVAFGAGGTRPSNNEVSADNVNVFKDIASPFGVNPPKGEGLKSAQEYPVSVKTFFRLTREPDSMKLGLRRPIISLSPELTGSPRLFGGLFVFWVLRSPEGCGQGTANHTALCASVPWFLELVEWVFARPCRRFFSFFPKPFVRPAGGVVEPREARGLLTPFVPTSPAHHGKAVSGKKKIQNDL